MGNKKQVEVRVLSNNQFGSINEVVKLDEEVAEQAVALGLVDAHPNGVKQAKQLAKAAEKAEKEEG